VFVPNGWLFLQFMKPVFLKGGDFFPERKDVRELFTTDLGLSFTTEGGKTSWQK